MTACPIRYQRQVPDRKGKIFYTSITSLSHISKLMRPFIGWSATVVITLGRSRMGSNCPLLSSPTGNDPAFPKLAVLAHSHAGGLGASFGSAITESLLPEKAIHLSRNTMPPGSNCYRLRHRKGCLVWKPLNLQRTFFLENLVLPEKKFLKTSPPY